MHIHSVWTVVGFAGQALFFGRFFVQWLASERAKRSVIPQAFWYFSLGGGTVLLLYAVFSLKDPVFTVGQAAGLFIYLRNLWFIHKGKRPPGASADPVADGAT